MTLFKAAAAGLVVARSGSKCGGGTWISSASSMMPHPIGVKIGPMPEIVEVYEVPAPVTFGGRQLREVGLAVKRLMDVADKMDEEFQRVEPMLRRVIPVRQDARETADLRNDAVAPAQSRFGSNNCV
jgi:hypothetical protein